MKCPNCKLINPPGAEYCDCGHVFATGKIAPAFVQDFPSPSKTQQAHQMKKGAGAISHQASGCIVVLGIAGLLWIFSILSPERTGSKKQERHLVARIEFTGTQFVIANADPFDWRNVELEVNAHGWTEGYKLHRSILRAGEIYTVGAGQFAKNGGERFNSFTMKPQRLSIHARETPHGELWYFGNWE